MRKVPVFNEPERLKLAKTRTYILSGELKTDILEKRFGICRQLNGANLLMSFEQVISVEQKVCILTRIKLAHPELHVVLIKFEAYYT